MKLAILFWFYKELEVSKNHLQILRKLNPGVPIYGLFGGDATEIPKYKKVFSPLLEDFYATHMPSSGKARIVQNKKWIAGELMLLEWYKNRGIKLEWDSIAIVQWDILLLAPVQKLFKGIKKDEIYISGTTPYSQIHAKRWWWTMPTKEGKDFPKFRKYIKDEYGFIGNPLVCLFMFQIMPRKFWEEFSQVPKPEIGMLEYKMPTYAKIFGLKFFKKDIGVRWFKNVKAGPMNAESKYVSDAYVKSELKKKNGWRIFHPYIRVWNDK